MRLPAAPAGPRAAFTLPAIGCAVAAFGLALAGPATAAGDATRGARLFQACAACHTLEPGRHRTGPSLAGIWGKKAAASPEFRRYSEALKRSGLVWNEGTLDKWLADPQAAVPGTLMTYQGISDPQPRADLIAFLRTAADGKASQARRGRAHPDLKNAPLEARVTAIRHCGDTYFVTAGTKQTTPFWEFNLRFKTDSGTSGPGFGHPVLVNQGMQGDRAQIVFSRSSEISSFIQEKC